MESVGLLLYIIEKKGKKDQLWPYLTRSFYLRKEKNTTTQTDAALIMLVDEGYMLFAQTTVHCR